MTEPKPGDKVRVTYTQTKERVVRFDGWYLWKPLVADGRATVEVIERADDPSKDPVGTMRQNGQLVVKSDSDAFPWQTVSGHAGGDNYYRDIEVIGWEIVGAAPGTPAAEPGRFTWGDDLAEAKERRHDPDFASWSLVRLRNHYDGDVVEVPAP